MHVPLLIPTTADAPSCDTRLLAIEPFGIPGEAVRTYRCVAWIREGRSYYVLGSTPEETAMYRNDLGAIREVRTQGKWGFVESGVRRCKSFRSIHARLPPSKLD